MRRRLLKSAGSGSQSFRQFTVLRLQTRIRVHWESHQAYLPQVDFGEVAVLPSAVGFDGSIADGEAVQSACCQEGTGFGAALHCCEQAAFDVETARVFCDLFPDADGLGGVMLPEEFDRTTAAREAGGECAGGDDVSTPVGIAKNGGVPFDFTAGGLFRKSDRGELGF